MMRSVQKKKDKQEIVDCYHSVEMKEKSVEKHHLLPSSRLLAITVIMNRVLSFHFQLLFDDMPVRFRCNLLSLKFVVVAFVSILASEVQLTVIT